MARCDGEDEPTEFVELEITVPTNYQNRVKVVNTTMARVRIQSELYLYSLSMNI